MKAFWVGLAATVSILAANSAMADGEEIAKANACLACHSVDKKIMGPAYKEVAAKYKGDKEAKTKLFDKIKKGGSGVWGAIPMPPNPTIKDADLKTVIDWILAAK